MLQPGENNCLEMFHCSRKVSLSTVPSFFEEQQSSARFISKKRVFYVYFSTTTQFLSVEIFKVMNNCFVNYLSSGSLLTRPGEEVRFSKPFSAHETAILRACNAFLAYMREQFSANGLHVACSKSKASVQCNRMFSNDGLHCELEGKHYQCIDMGSRCLLD